MSKLLIEENPLVVLPSLAKEFGLVEAIIIQQLHYWIEHTGPDGRRYGKLSNGKRWIRNTVEQWRESNFPFLSDSQIYRAIKSLEEEGVIISRQDLNSTGYDRTKWYTLDYSIFQIREMEISLSQNGFFTSEETIPETTTENTKETTNTTGGDVFSHYENNIGPITPHIREAIIDYLEECPETWLVEAMNISAENGIRKWSYIKAILDRWLVEGKTNGKKKTNNTPAVRV